MHMLVKKEKKNHFSTYLNIPMGTVDAIRSIASLVAVPKIDRRE